MFFGNNTCKYGNSNCDPTWGLCKYCRASIELDLEAKKERLRMTPRLSSSLSTEGAVGQLIGSLFGLAIGELSASSRRNQDLDGDIRKAQKKVKSLKSRAKRTR